MGQKIKTYFLLSCLFFYGSVILGQTANVHSNMITCFSQGHAGSGATNCASISVIKLAIAKYGLNGVFIKIDTLPSKYVFHLRNGNKTELTATDISTMENLNKFHSTTESDTVKAAKIMYAVMAKNKLQQSNGTFSDLSAAASEQGGWFLNRYMIYQLVTDTWENFKLLGLELLKIKKIDASEVQNFTDIIITSSRHSAYCSSGTYDDYGTPVPLSEFSGLHRQLNENMNYILLD